MIWDLNTLCFNCVRDLVRRVAGHISRQQCNQGEYVPVTSRCRHPAASPSKTRESRLAPVFVRSKSLKKAIEMGKRKLRACANCGGRHGPPTGKGCNRGAELLAGKSEEMQATLNKPGGAVKDGDVESRSGISEEFTHEKEELDYSAASNEGAPTGKFEFVRQASMNYQQTYEKSRSPPTVDNTFDPLRLPGESTFERSMASRMDYLENVMGRVAGVQQAQLERLVHLANHPCKPPPAAATATASSAATPAPAPVVKAPVQPIPEPAMSELEFDGTEDQEWKEFYGIEVWRKEIERRRKNPFDQKIYMSKGEAVEDLEQVMVVAFKTIIQLLDLGQDVRGVAKHGLFMAEKASKDVYEPIAFLKYDECVRERAGKLGPVAFSTVEQEDVIRCFCFDNTKAAKAKEGASRKSKQKSGKYCFRFNDTGCNAKSCAYTHRCSGCEDSNHGKKDCTAQKKKEKK